MQAWQLQDAKNRLSEVIRQSHQAPQLITLRGKEEAVVLSFDDYKRLAQPKQSWLELMSAAPVEIHELDLQRSGDIGRSVDL